MSYIAIIDYGMGNLRSVQKALEHVGFKAEITDSIQAITNASGVILPGVGHFGAAMDRINEKRLVSTIRDVFGSGVPFLGICMGLQLLFEYGEEAPSREGLSILEGGVPKFRNIDLPVPHMGWNTIRIQKKAPIYEGLPENGQFYFVHSYYVAPEDRSIVASTTGYGIEFCSSVWVDNAFAVQFHPEKSGDLGLQLLKNFGNLTR